MSDCFLFLPLSIAHEKQQIVAALQAAYQDDKKSMSIFMYEKEFLAIV
jgi:hypothetical protein